MGFKDLQVVVVMLVWLCFGHTIEVGADTPGAGVSPEPASLTNSTFPRNWHVELGNNIQPIIKSQNGAFIFSLELTDLSESSCAATVRHTSDTVIWVANFHSNNSNLQSPFNPVQECILSFTNEGLLLSYTSNINTKIWSSKLNRTQSGMGNLTLEIGDTGCLYMKDDTSRTVWKSFDYPGDTLVNGQPLMPGTTLSAARMMSDYSTGEVFSMRIEGESLALFQAFKAEGGISSNISYASFSKKSNNNVSFQLVPNNLFAFYYANRGLGWDYVKLQYTGGLLLKTFDPAGLERQLVGDGTICSLPAACGAFKICLRDSSCVCPEGFISNQSTCQPILDTLSSYPCNSSTKVVNVTGQVYASLPNFTEPYNSTAKDCEMKCEQDCNCRNALHVTRNDSRAQCFINVASVQTIRQLDSGAPVQTLFLRIPLVVGDGGGVGGGGGGGSARRTAALAFAGVAGALVLVLLAASTWWLVTTRPKLGDEADQLGGDGSEISHQFSYKQLAESTSNFARRLGYGGVSFVYAGNLGDTTNAKVAVKKLDDRGYKDKAFLAAVSTMATVAHPNLVPLVGYCKDGKHKLLVYELVNEGRALNWFLFNAHDSGPLIITVATRRAIALGTARGLQHLHEEYSGFIHGGVKPENIMITSDKDMRPKLVDYGLVTLSSRFASLTEADSRNARGYMAPEWMTPSAPLTTKSDVYSLGVVILELVSGRRCLVPHATPPQKRYLPTWGFALLQRDDSDLDSILELVDPRLDATTLSQFDQQVLKGMAFVALWCVQSDPNLRPSISQVIRMLEGVETVNVPPISPSLDTFDLEQQQQQHPHTPSHSLSSSSLLSDNTRPSAFFCCPRLATKDSRRDHTWLLHSARQVDVT